GIVIAEFLPVPVFDQTVEHVEVVREIDDAGRIAMREANRNAAGERPVRRYKSILQHGEGLLSLLFLRRQQRPRRKPSASAEHMPDETAETLCPPPICELQFDSNQGRAGRKVSIFNAEGVKE